MLEANSLCDRKRQNFNHQSLWSVGAQLAFAVAVTCLILEFFKKSMGKKWMGILFTRAGVYRWTERLVGFLFSCTCLKMSNRRWSAFSELYASALLPVKALAKYLTIISNGLSARDHKCFYLWKPPKNVCNQVPNILSCM